MYPPSGTPFHDEATAAFRQETNNVNFQPGVMTWISLGVLLVFYPALSILSMGEDTAALLKSLTEGTLAVLLIVTILMQWAIYAINYGAVYLEGTGLAGVGLVRIRGVDFAWGIAFLLAANVILSGVAWVLGQVGLPMPGEIQMLIPSSASGRVIWVAVSFTAGFCEEIAFRGYLMTRIRLLTKVKSWIIPAVISAVVFGVSHGYQGLPGVILLSIYGLMFSLLYIRTGRLWPCIIAHFFQDFIALFAPWIDRYFQLGN